MVHTCPIFPIIGFSARAHAYFPLLFLVLMRACIIPPSLLSVMRSRFLRPHWVYCAYAPFPCVICLSARMRHFSCRWGTFFALFLGMVRVCTIFPTFIGFSPKGFHIVTWWKIARYGDQSLALRIATQNI